MRIHPLAWPIVVALMFAGALNAGAAEVRPGNPVHNCTLLGATPDVDGLLHGDAAWASVPDVAGPFHLLEPGAGPAPKATRFRVGHTATGIWFAVTCHEPDMGRILAEHDDMGALWDEDSIELFVAPGPGQPRLHLAVNAIGSRWNEPYQGDRALLDWKAATFLGEHAWSAEIFIPYETLGAVPDLTAAWGLNVCRTARTVEPAQRSSWAPCRARFAESESRGLLTFTGAGLTAAERAAALKRVAARQAARATRTDEVFAVVRPDIGLQVVRPGQASDVTLVRLTGGHVAPRLTPDCTRVYYQSLRGGRIGVWSVAIDDPTETRICDGEQVGLDPSGTRIVLVRHGALVERDLGSGRERTLRPRDPRESPSYPAWLPDARILYVADQKRLCVIPARDGAPETLARGEILSAPRVSPDGTQVAYPDGCHIRLLDLASGKSRRLALGGGVQSWPLWARDSKSLCYCQGDTPDNTVVDLYRVALDQPDTIQLVATRVAPGPDWSGIAPKIVRQTKLPRATLRILTGAGARPPSEELLRDTRVGWQELERAPVPGNDCLLDAHAACLEISASAGRIALWIKGQDRPRTNVVVTVADRSGRPALGPKSLAWHNRAPERAEIDVEFAAPDGAPVRARLAFDAARPLLGIFPGSNLGEVRLRTELSRVATVDRLADDLLFDPSDVAADQSPLPETPMTVGFVASDPTALLLLIPGRAGQKLHVCKEQGGSQFTGFKIRPGNAPVHIGGLADASISPGAAWTRKPETDEWRIPWAHTVLGRWRAAVRTGNEARSATIDVAARLDTLTTVMGAGDPPPAGAPCAVYLFDRNPQTDPAILTAMDLFRDALGIGEAERRMDERGVRECRAAQVECPFKDSDVAVRMLTWITPNDPAPAQALARFAADVGHMLRGNDARLGEYRALFDALAQLLAGTDVSQSAPDPAWARLGDIIRSGQAIPQPATAAADVDAAIHAIRDAAAEPARLKTDLVKRLVALAEKAFPERTVLLGQCRRLAKDARDTAGLLTPRFPARAALLEEVSAAAGRTLRLRYFHEADWRGELPLNPELVDYEKFRKVR